MEASFVYQVLILKKQFTNFCNERLQKMGLSIGLMFFIIYIGKHEPCSPGELSTAIRMDTGHTTRSIDKLVKGGFVKKERSNIDRRSQVICLTEKGREAFERVYLLFEEWEEQVLNDMTKDEKETLHLLLDKIIKKEQDDVRDYAITNRLGNFDTKK